VNDEYLFTLTVYDPTTKLSNKKSVIVNVVPASIVAVLAGLGTAAVIFERSLVVDASSSFDQDKSGKNGMPACISLSVHTIEYMF
jgi:hypothetical protein